MIHEPQCYINVLSVHLNYIIVSLVGPKVILKAGEVATMGLGVGILSHQNIQYLQTRERERACLSLVFIFYSNIVSHHNNQEEKFKTDLGSLTL